MTTAVARTGVLRRLNAPAWVASETLNVAPNLLGQPLARPSRRALAMAVDGLAVGLLSSTGALWIAAAIAALVFQLRRRQPERSLRRNVWLWLALALLVIMAAQYMVDWVQHWDNPVRARVERADTDDDAGDILAGLAASALPASPASAGTVQSALRIARLEAELEQAKKLRPVRWRDEMVDSAHRLGLGFGWAIAYFTLLPLWWQGQTLGKKALGLRVVELTGKPLGLMHCLGRYGGYAAAMATGGIGFAQVLWDANRQAIQDKIAHTVVLDLRAPGLLAAGGSAYTGAPQRKSQ